MEQTREFDRRLGRGWERDETSASNIRASGKRNQIEERTDCGSQPELRLARGDKRVPRALLANRINHPPRGVELPVDRGPGLTRSIFICREISPFRPADDSASRGPTRSGNAARNRIPDYLFIRQRETVAEERVNFPLFIRSRDESVRNRSSLGFARTWTRFVRWKLI